uniref:Uncharacterized protein n=1 Tax=Oryza glumipatula TaxID=40148 RepID=A0A0D9YRG8_9ORYZ
MDCPHGQGNGKGGSCSSEKPANVSRAEGGGATEYNDDGLVRLSIDAKLDGNDDTNLTAEICERAVRMAYRKNRAAEKGIRMVSGLALQFPKTRRLLLVLSASSSSSSSLLHGAAPAQHHTTCLAPSSNRSR